MLNLDLDEFVTAFEHTKMAKARGERELNEAAWRDVPMGTGDAFYLLDRKLGFLYASRRALAIWGRTQDELIGRRLVEVFPHAPGSAAYEAHRRVLRTGEEEHFEIVSPLLDHGFEVDIYPSSCGISVAFRDIDDRNQA